ncbi:MAG: AhpC/TSA family protein [Bacteroidales bacterium]|nr:AhpC/TSA family protein [Bacteroidales bacterium]
MKRVVILALALVLTFSCAKTPTAMLSGTAEGLSDTCLVLQRLDLNSLVQVDTLTLGTEGAFNYKVELPGETPTFYYLYDGERQAAALVLLPGDKVTVKVGAYDYEVEGSEESALLKQIDEAFYAARVDMERYADLLNAAPDDDAYTKVATEMSRSYIDYKRGAVAQIMNNPKSITSAIIPFQRFSEQLPVFNEHTDVILFKQLYDSLQTVYPKSQYVVALGDEINRREQAFDLNQKLDRMSTISYPELNLPDVEGRDRILSDLEGKVIILSFWTAANADQKMYNQTLKDLYAKYHDAGLEIYQVSLDVDKAMWASTVKSQELPWISVNDGLGAGSPARVAYNIGQLPSLFVINREGDVLSRDVFAENELEALVKKSL